MLIINFILISAILWSQLWIQQAQSVAIAKVKFIYYSNPRGLLHNGDRCDPRIFLNQGHCDPFFTIEIKVGGHTFVRKSDRAKEKKTVNFGSKIVDIDNPLVNRVENYFGQLEISVTVDDYDLASSDDHMGSFRHRFTGPARPFSDPSAPQEIRLVDSGRAAAELVLQISVQCEVNYYGPDCSKFCQARSDSQNGHYLCSWDGKKICEPTYDSTTDCREKFCSSEPCDNGGTCVNLPSGYACECQQQFGGPRCTEKLAPCQHNRPCQNGGTCKNGVGCSCPVGFHGDACQLDVDECQSIAPCRGNGSVCDNWFGTYSCRCGPGWSGRNCTEDIDECALAGYPKCFNGGSCENKLGGFLCHCPPGFHGHRCQEDVNECQVGSGPCLNETQVCQNLWGDYICMCRDEFKGPNCTLRGSELAESLTSDFQPWPPVVAAALAISVVAALLLLWRSSVCSGRRIRTSALKSSSADEREKASTDNPAYCEEEFDTAAEDVAPYDEPQEVSNLGRTSELELSPPPPPPPLPPMRSLNGSTQYQIMMTANDEISGASSVQAYT